VGHPRRRAGDACGPPPRPGVASRPQPQRGTCAMTPDQAAMALPLRDIHLPPEPAFWPPAPGWWLLAAVLLGAGLVLGRHLLRWRARRRWRRAIEAELDAIAADRERDLAARATALSALLRRVARLIDPAAVALS